MAIKIIDDLCKNLAYYKLPCFIQFVDNIPITSTQKTKKSVLKEKINMKSKFFYNLESNKRHKKLLSNTNS